MYEFNEKRSLYQSSFLAKMIKEWKSKPIDRKKRVIIKAIIILLCIIALSSMAYLLIKQFTSGETVVNMR